MEEQRARQEKTEQDVVTTSAQEAPGKSTYYGLM